LRDRYLDLGRRPEEVPRRVVGRDLPSGACAATSSIPHPFKGFEKPIYAIPAIAKRFSALDGCRESHGTDGHGAAMDLAAVDGSDHAAIDPVSLVR
jgi:hypothetical protein